MFVIRIDDYFELTISREPKIPEEEIKEEISLPLKSKRNQKSKKRQ
jgi:hypothetical protein